MASRLISLESGHEAQTEHLQLKRPTANIHDGDATGLAREEESTHLLTAEERTTSELAWMGIASH